jgi:chloride channel protein, CIC family
MEGKSLFDKFINIFNTNYLKSDISKYLFHIIISILLGVLSGAGAILFHYLLVKMRYFFDPENFTKFLRISKYYIFIIPVIGAFTIALFNRIFKKSSGEAGIISVIKSIILNNGFISLKTTVFHFFAPIISIGTGIPLGPEAPAARAGSGIGSYMSQILQLDQKDMRMYTAAGAAAAISAIFNAPIAGVFFGIEVILLNDLKNQALSALIISSVVADMLSQSILGVHHIISIPEYIPGGAGDLHIYLLMGAICGLASLFYFIFKGSMERLFYERLKIKNKSLALIVVSFMFGIVLIKYYSLFGIGYDTINNIVSGVYPVHTVFILFIFKIIFMALFVTAGAYGGTFAPSLSLGVMLGYSFAIFMNSSFGLTLDPVTFALIGMGGILSGINSIPLTSILLVFEITNDYKFILPLMLASIISYLVTIYYNKGTVYENILHKMEIDVTRKGEIDLLGKIDVRELMIVEYDEINYRTPFRKLVDVLLKSAFGNVIVINDKNRVVGVITMNDVRQVMLSEEMVDLFIAADIMTSVPFVTEDEKVSAALQEIKKYDIECVPVIKKGSKYIIAGILTHQKITSAYYDLLEKWETDQFIINYNKK